VLDDAHQAGFLHGDIKPSNVFLTPDDKICVFDWGSACAEDIRRPEGFGVAGTLTFLSDEAILGLSTEADIREDIYALGIFLLYLATGHALPIEQFSGSPKEAVVWKGLAFAWLAGTEAFRSLPRGFRDILQVFMNAEREHFPESAGDLVDMCQQAYRKPEQAVTVPVRADIISWRLGFLLCHCGAAFYRVLGYLQRIYSSAMRRADFEATVRRVRDNAYDISVLSHRIHNLAARLEMRLIPLPDEEACLLAQACDLSPATMQRFTEDAARFLDETYEICRTAAPPDLMNKNLWQLGYATVLAVFEQQGRFLWLSTVQDCNLPKEITEEFSRACRLAAKHKAMSRLAPSLDYRVKRYLRWGLSSPTDERVFGRRIAPRVFEG
jgi:serine/threonine protein kinase